MTGETLETVDGRHVLRMERRLAHRPEKVWRAITEPGQWSVWFPATVELDTVAVGAAIRYHFDKEGGDDDGGAGTVTAAERPHLFEYTWDGSILRWELHPDGDGCRLVFVHTFDDRPGAASFAAGWDACIDGLRQMLAGDPIEQPGRMVAAHEAYVKRFGLDQGVRESTQDGWRIRFERQLTAPDDATWAAVSPGATPTVGAAVPAWFGAGVVTAVDAPRLVEFDTPDGHVRWELTEGTGHGARLVLTYTGTEDVGAAWRERVEGLAARLAT